MKSAKAALSRVPVLFEDIKISHSVFALPFAVSAAFMAADGFPEPVLLGKIVLACVLARTAAMAFNRFADASIDSRNPRTAGRAVPAGFLSPGFMLGAAVVASLGFVVTAWWINRLAFYLSPVALLVLLGYSYTKRFTSLSHVVLGAALGLSPLGAWIAVREEFHRLPATLGTAVLFWVGGFDVIYACQDREVDRAEGLRSLPARLGLARALFAARLFHVVAVALLVVTGSIAGYGPFYYFGVALVAALLVYEHAIVSPSDLSRVNVAFLTLNGLVSLFFMAAVLAEIVLS